MEIERKYGVKVVPANIEQYEVKEIEQGYLCNNPIVRIRKSNEDYFLTYKSKLGVKQQVEGMPIINNEVELPLTKEAYDILKTKTEHNLVCKTRYLVPLQDGLVAEMDFFQENLLGLIMVEVEFQSEEQANTFVKPEWFGDDWSMDQRFSNYALSKLSGYNQLA